MNRRAFLKVIATLECVGGIYGLITLLFGWVRNRFDTDQFICVSVGTALFTLSFFAGVMLWRNRRIGYFTSTLAQFAQLVKIATPHFAFMIAYGADLAIVSISNQDAAPSRPRVLNYSLVIGSPPQIEIDRPPGATQVFGLSIFSCVALNALRKGRTPAPDGNSIPVPREPVPSDGQPDWIVPFRVKLAATLFVLIVASCAGCVVVR